MLYIQKHWKIFLKSFNIDMLALKLLATDILFIFTLVLSYSLLYLFWLKNVFSVATLLGISNGVVPAASNMDISALWHSFIIKVLLILLLGVLIYLVLISLYSAFSHTFINRKKFTLKLFLNFLSIYSILTFLYILVSVIIFNISNNIIAIAWGVIILTLLYVYALLIFYLVINDGTFSKILHHGWKSMIRLHDTLLPLAIGLILIMITSIIIELLFGNFIIVSAILAMLVFLYLTTWLKKYLHHIIHEV
jgi:hypothetical protein